jgi:hypothetical protein
MMEPMLKMRKLRSASASPMPPSLSLIRIVRA